VIRFLRHLWVLFVALPVFAQLTPGACGAYSSCANATTCDLVLPPFTNGNLLVAFGGGSDSTLTGTMIIDEPGWTGILNTGSTGGVDRLALVAVKIAAGDTGSQTMTLSSGAAATNDWRGRICVLPSASATPDATSVAGPNTNGTATPDFNAITTTTNNALVCAMDFANNGTSSGPLVAPSGYSDWFEEVGTLSMGVWCKTVASPGSEDPGTASGFNAANAHAGGTVAFRYQAQTGAKARRRH
jgi:hypothetical protein